MRGFPPAPGVARSRQHPAKIRSLASRSPTRIGSFRRIHSDDYDSIQKALSESSDEVNKAVDDS